MSIARACKQCQARIRELEAELATERQAGQIELGQRIAWRIRAEKAETDAHESLGLVRFLEARVAELEAGLLGCRQARSELEAELAELAKDHEDCHHEVHDENEQRWDRAEARVAELQRHSVVHLDGEVCDGTCECLDPRYGHEDRCPSCGRPAVAVSSTKTMMKRTHDRIRSVHRAAMRMFRLTGPFRI